MDIIQEVEKLYMKEETASFKVADVVKVEYLIREGDKERIQPFVGQVIRFGGSGIRKTFTVRRIVQGEGVERTFPLHGPRVTNVIVQRGPTKKPRRARLYYLRDRVGKSASL
ncbi:MAG: 50S ribosomal protein L19 [Planctomycetes bacterium]|jgi:large subunit ribosomal protein L19|nr:50S ribosomal protein L19 [Planctomycetota bacterium]MBT4028774.1 50S ribosomal protein L19 [Planctomycetota bacterium]MBT4559666.1 50S ribosomal protein L19 [Planctomycetota bacterium]MBT5100856.1 50S ribosomal protein L19 [Planctomycetota bacterium]MBT5120308.1 50S ribosomal protein L19 [Planctomycetota bacterium]